MKIPVTIKTVTALGSVCRTPAPTRGVMTLFGKVVLSCYLLSAAMIAIASSFEALRFLVGHAIFLGWCSVVMSTLAFLIGSAIHLTGRMPNYWRTLIPLNFGLGLTGWSFVAYDGSSDIGLTVAAIVAAGSCAVVMVMLVKAVRLSRLLPAIFLLPLFLAVPGWQKGVAVGYLFLLMFSLSYAVNYRKH